jgi:hypothetical protein
MVIYSIAFLGERGLWIISMCDMLQHRGFEIYLKIKIDT